MDSRRKIERERMKNVLVIGANGMLGYALTKFLLRKGNNVKGLTRKEFDIAKESMFVFESYLDSVNIVINCAGVIKPRIKDMAIEDVINVNSIFPRNLVKVCNNNNILCFHITTDCVYSGKKGNYNENDYFDATDIYGMTKNSGDIKDCMTLRTSIIGEEKGQNRSLLEWVLSQKGKEVNGFTNHYWNGITTVYLAEIIEKIFNNNLYQKGIFHIFSKKSVSKYELLKIINDVYNLNIKIRPFEADTKIDRTLDSIFNLSRNLVKKSISKQIKDMKEFFEYNGE